MKLNCLSFYVLYSGLLSFADGNLIKQAPAPLLKRANFDSKGTLLLWKRITACEGSVPDSVQAFSQKSIPSSRTEAWWSFPWFKQTKPAPPPFERHGDSEFQSAYWGLQEYSYFHVPELACFEAAKNTWCNQENGKVYEVTPLSDTFLKVDFFDIDADICNNNVWLEDSYFNTPQPTASVVVALEMSDNRTNHIEVT